MAENITSVLDKDEAGTLSFADVLYLIQGDGADRDRNVTLERIRDFFSLNFKNLKVDQTNFGIRAEDGYLKVSTPGGKAYISGDEIEFYDNSGTLKGEMESSHLDFPLAKVDFNLLKTDANGNIFLLNNNRQVVATITPKFVDENPRVFLDCALTVQDALNVTGKSKYGTGSDYTEINGGNLSTQYLTTFNVNAGGTVTAAKLKTSGGLVLKHLDSVDQLPSNPEDGEMYMVKYGDADALYIFDAKTNNKWRTVSLGGVYPA